MSLWLLKWWDAEWCGLCILESKRSLGCRIVMIIGVAGCGLWVLGLGFGVVWVGVGRHEAQAPSSQVKNYKQT